MNVCAGAVILYVCYIDNHIRELAMMKVSMP
jgi:hypothetical protein